MQVLSVYFINVWLYAR